jgi:hypothetical protein
MTRIAIASLSVLASLAAAAPVMAGPPAEPAPAAPTPDAARSLTIDVPPEGGAYTIDVHPQILTVLHFPAEVRVAYCLDGPGHAEITHHQYSVTVRPDRRARHAGINVTTASNHVGVLLRVVDRPEDAVLQVHFRDQDVAAEIERRVSATIEQRRAELEASLSARAKRLDEQERQFEELVRIRGGQRLTDALHLRFGVRKVTHIVRRDNAVLRVHRVVRIGDDVHVFVSLENRRGTPLQIDIMTMQFDQTEPESLLARLGGGYTGTLGTVRPGTTATGVISIAAVKVGAVIRLRLHEPGGREPFEISLKVED